MRYRTASIIVSVALALSGSACGADPTPTSITPPPAAVTSPTLAPSAQTTPPTSLSPHPTSKDPRLPPLNADFDYQLGGAYPPPAGVTVVARDRTQSPAPGLYNICYVNGFQIQPWEEDWWEANHPDLILRDNAGKPVIDPDWDEILLAPTSPERRSEIARVIGEWIAGCAANGFDAVEIDNLDSYTRSTGLIAEDDAVAQMRTFTDAAHAVGLPIAQKNAAEIVGRAEEMGTDFAVAEECNRFRECDAYTGAYGDQVLVIEYRRPDFAAGCADYPTLSIVLRDLKLVVPADKAYLFEVC